MIYTRFGSVILIKDQLDGGYYICEHIQKCKNCPHEFHLADLKADNGIKEIEEAISTLESGAKEELVRVTN